MSFELKNLSEYESNTYSQNGEDGVIEECLYRLSQDLNLDKWGVEFGAHNGLLGSNSLRLAREEQYKLIMIEGSKHLFYQMKKNLKNDNVICLNKVVNFEGNDIFDNMVNNLNLPIDFDLLSIDIDGCDYHVFDSIRKYKPKIVVIEYNYTIPDEIDFIQAKNLKLNHGSSAKSIIALAKAKGYKLVYGNLVNLIFIKDECFAYEKFQEIKLSEIGGNRMVPTYLFVGYDGSLLSNSELITFPWQKLQVPLAKIQYFPIHIFLRAKNPFFRYTLLYLFYFFYLSFVNPKELNLRLKKVIRRIL
jgi:hypothetical protein